MAKKAAVKDALFQRLVGLRKLTSFQGVWNENPEMNALARKIQADVEKEVLALIRKFEITSASEVTWVLEKRLMWKMAECYRLIIGNAMRDLVDSGELEPDRNLRLRLNPGKEKPDECESGRRRRR